MTTNHIDQLTEWWETAEEGAARKGDTIIVRYGADEYSIRPADADLLDWPEDIRILARAPKPKPAWHDAVAVIASTDRTERQVWERESDGTYSGSAGDTADDVELRNVIPLIEAKVTDEMVLAALNASTRLDMLTVTSFKRDEIEDMRLALTAALGLETK